MQHVTYVRLAPGRVFALRGELSLTRKTFSSPLLFFAALFSFFVMMGFFLSSLLLFRFFDMALSLETATVLRECSIGFHRPESERFL